MIFLRVILVFTLFASGRVEAQMLEKPALATDMNGMALINSNQSSTVLVAAIGEDVDNFIQQNSFLSGHGKVGKSRFYLPLISEVTGVYDDGVIRFNVGCSSITNVIGNEDYFGVTSVGFQLCKSTEGDWKLITSMVADSIRKFHDENPAMQRLSEYRKKSPRTDDEEIWGIRLSDRLSKTQFPLDEDAANEFFRKERERGDIAQVKLGQGTLIVLEPFMNQSTVVTFDVLKTNFDGDDSLNSVKKDAMRFRPVITFLRKPGTGRSCAAPSPASACN